MSASVENEEMGTIAPQRPRIQPSVKGFLPRSQAAAYEANLGRLCAVANVLSQFAPRIIDSLLRAFSRGD